MTKTLVINGNPKQTSLCKSLAETYTKTYQSNSKNIEIIHLYDLAFDLNLIAGYSKNQELEQDLLAVKKLIKEATHIVLISPVWWGTMPAKLKGLFDRVFSPGFAFQYKEGKNLPKKLLINKTCRIIITMDSPVWYYRWVIGDALIKTLKKPILEFCGIRVKKINRFGPVLNSREKARKNWIKKVEKYALKDQN